MFRMKTTIDLPDEILHRAKVMAAQRKTTLKAMVLEGLTFSLSGAVLAPESMKQQKADRLLAALRSGNTKPMRPLTRDEIYDRRKLP